MARYNLTTAIPYVNGRPAHRPRAGARPGGRAGPPSTAARRRGAVPVRHRRQRAQERPRGRGRGDLHAGLRDAATPTRFEDLADAARPLLRRLHPHERRSAAPPRRRLPLAPLRERATCTAAVRGPLLRRLRAVLRAGRTDRRAAARSTAPRRTVVAEENWFFRLSRYEDQLVDLIESDRCASSRPPPQRGALAFMRLVSTTSASRARDERARGWGIPVPDDPAR